MSMKNLSIFSLSILLFVAVLSACSENSDNDNGEDKSVDTIPGSTDDSELIELSTDLTGECTTLFGSPGENSGLTENECSPVCNCGGSSYEAPQYSENDIENLKKWSIDKDVEPLESDPYLASGDTTVPKNSVCAVSILDQDALIYSLKTYSSQDEATTDGAIVTHTGACGQCSSLYNLAAYISQSDMTKVVRQCGIDAIANGGMDYNIKCLEELGFDYPCAQIWYYNTKNTTTNCGSICISFLNAPYHNNDGSLNDCLQCDEDKSGDVFKAVAGRTRRNSGLPSSICRPCDTVAHIDHHNYK
ncbi:MAG: hypothetical protein JXR91_09870 [Deltaproteobacteria bacterium]|nr:hypothetical protein [Deltaproteobacteria bacterium]